MGLAVGLTMVPLFWLAAFGRTGGSPSRATGSARSAAGAGSVCRHACSSSCGSRALLELPIALFMIALVVVAEATLSAER